jgi:hypothetical protein
MLFPVHGAKQAGGNPSGAPLFIFTENSTLQQHYPLRDAPSFQPVAQNKFWGNKY